MQPLALISLLALVGQANPPVGPHKVLGVRYLRDLSKFEFIKQDQPAPDTVNPSLWRVSQLVNFAGLFEVVPGVYQVRGADLANMTIVEGEKGITIYDPLAFVAAAGFLAAITAAAAYIPARRALGVAPIEALRQI